MIVTSSTHFQPVEMVPMELIALITAAETVRVITLVTEQTELALNAHPGGKINFVTTVRKFKKHISKRCIF